MRQFSGLVVLTEFWTIDYQGRSSQVGPHKLWLYIYILLCVRFSSLMHLMLNLSISYPSLYIKESNRCVSVRPSDILLAGKLRVMGITQCQEKSLSVMGITQCLVCLWGKQGPSVQWVNSWVGCENFRWEEKSLRVSVSLSVRVSLTVMGILLGVFVMGITQCNGYPLGRVRNGYHSV